MNVLGSEPGGVEWKGHDGSMRVTILHCSAISRLHTNSQYIIITVLPFSAQYRKEQTLPIQDSSRKYG